MPIARFIGGSLDGAERRIAGCREYVVSCQASTWTATAATWLTSRPARWVEFYMRTGVVYVDGADHANEHNRERLSHVVMTFDRREDRK